MASYMAWREKEEEKVLNRLKDNKKTLAIGHSLAFYRLDVKHLEEQYLNVIKHVKNMASWDEIEHAVYEGLGITLTLDAENINENLTKLKELIELREKELTKLREEIYKKGRKERINLREEIYKKEGVYLVFSLIKDLRNLEEIENFMSSMYLRSDNKKEWLEFINTNLHSKDGTHIRCRLKYGERGILYKHYDKDEFLVEFQVYVEYKDNKIHQRIKEIIVSNILLAKVLKEGLFSEYFYRLLKTAKDVEGALKHTIKNKKNEHAGVAFSVDLEKGRVDFETIPVESRLKRKIEESIEENCIHDLDAMKLSIQLQNMRQIML